MIEIDEYGAGPPLVLVHGSPANGRTWRAVGERLSDRFRVIAPTLPGHEAAGERTTEAMTTEEMAAAIDQAVGNEAGPVRLAAHSFGGNVALHIALRRRMDIDRLVLLEPVTMMILPIAGRHAEFAQAKSTFESYVARFEAGESRAVETMIGFWFGPGAFARMAEPVQAYLIERTAANIRDVHANFGETYSSTALGELGVPTTVAYGGASPAILRTIAEATAGVLGNASMEVFEGATHGMLASHAEAVAEIIGRAPR